MQKTFIDITELANWEGPLTGVPRVMDELCVRFYEEKESIVFVKWNTEKACLVETSHKKKNKHKSITRISNILNRKDSSAQEIDLTKGDVLVVLADWHSNDANFVKYLLEKKTVGISLIQFVYDLLPIVTPQFSGHATEYLTRYVQNIYPICNTLIAISNNTKKDIIDWLKNKGLTRPNIEVIRLGDDFHIVKPNSPKTMVKKEDLKSYILCVGTVEARKNHLLLYYVYKLAQQRNITLPKLVIVGRIGWHAENVYELLTVDPEINSWIIVLNNINDNELSWLYSNALFTVYPSFYEGWGLPIAESINYGKVCISSNTSSMPEIAGNMIRYFSPFSADECLAAILDFMKPELLSEYTSKIKRYKKTSWDETFQSVRDIIRKYEQ